MKLTLPVTEQKYVFYKILQANNIICLDMYTFENNVFCTFKVT